VLAVDLEGHAAPAGTVAGRRHGAPGGPPWWRGGAGVALATFVIALPLSITGSEAALAVMLGLLVVGLALRYRGWTHSALDMPLLLFLGALVLSTMVRGPSKGALDAYGDLWVMGAYVATVALLRDSRHASRLAAVMVGVTAVVAVYGVVQYFTGIDAYRDLMGREREVESLAADPRRFVVVGFFSSSLTYAHSLIVPLGWALAATVARGRWVVPRAVAAGSVALILVGLLLSTARGGWIAGAVVLGLAFLIGEARHRVAVAVGAAAIAIVAFSVSPGLRAEARSIIVPSANAGRVAIYGANLDIVRDHPVFGVGYGNYDREARAYYERYPEADRRSHAHNSFLQVAADAGLVGLSAFCLVFGTLLWRGWGLMRGLAASRSVLWSTAAGAWLGIIGFLVGAITQDTFGDSECALPMWFAAAVLMTIDQQVAVGGDDGARGC